MSQPLTWSKAWRWNAPGLVWNGLAPETKIINKRKTMSLTTTEVFGFADAVNQAMTSNQTALQTQGVAVTTWLTEGAALKATAVTKNDQQEAAKAALKTLTGETDAALQSLYDFYSTKLDAMAAALGKTSDQGKALLRLRSNIRRGSNPAPAPATP